MTGTGRGVQGVVFKMLHAVEFRLSVVATTLECGGLMKRITFASPDKLPDALFEPAAWMRLWFRTREGREVQRAYTVAGFSPDHRTVDVSFYLHQTRGPAASWAVHVRAGSTLNASLLGSHPFHVDARARRVVLVGDETAFPALRSILISLPETIETRVLLTGDHDLMDFVPRREAAVVRYAPVQRAVRSFDRMIHECDDAHDHDGAMWHCWAAGESSMMRAIRACARNSDVPCSHLSTMQAYWSLHRII